MNILVGAREDLEFVSLEKVKTLPFNNHMRGFVPLPSKEDIGEVNLDRDRGQTRAND